MLFVNLRTVLKITTIHLLLRGTVCLRDVYMVVPEAVERGSKVVMKCMYDLENEELYQVKWYRGDREFCRYAPRDVPPLRLFPIKGIDVVLDETDTQTLTIRSATRTMNGRYTCEVSADAPSFLTAQVHASMYVVDLPKVDPEIYGMQLFYRPGMKLKVECVSYNSQPPANLSFFVNNEPAHHRNVWKRVSSVENGSFWNSYSTIQFVVQKHHFVRHKLKIRCTSIIYNIYIRSYEKCSLEEIIHTTPESFPEIRHAVAFPRHRTVGTNATKFRSNASLAFSGIFCNINILIIQFVLR
ncbi:uncharacterized protein [Epargyreus clarus]|uniref:uncharacterized protein n=1 Tax=Epargyreus clarus TaxID=520877 RepID=UPI003C2BDDB4